MAGRSNALAIRKLVSYLAYAFRTFVLAQERPFLFGVVITDKCNLDCHYCEGKNKGRTHFSAGQARVALRDAHRRGHRLLYITGGEPMLWESDGMRLADLVRYARDLGFVDVLIYTNGTVPLSITDCSYIVSIDGPRRVHNEIRGGSWDRIMESVRGAATRNVSASFTFTKANARYFEECVEEICELGLFRQIFFNFLTHAPDIVEREGISLEERSDVLDRVWSLKERGYPIALSRAACQALKDNTWKRPIPRVELATQDRVFPCCRDVGDPAICENCGYTGCAEISQVLALKPTAMLQGLRLAWQEGRQ